MVAWHEAGRPDMLLAREEGRWRLERPVRRYGVPAGWAVVAEAPFPTLLDGVSAEAGELVTFEGRRRTVELAEDGRAVQLTLIEGLFTGASGSWASCRLMLEGDDRAAARVAMALAETVALSIPAGGWGEEAIRRAQGGEADARGPALVSREATVDEAIRSVLGELASLIARWSPQAARGTTPEAVHQMRVAIRRLRSAMLVFKRPLGGTLDGLRGPLTELASALGAARDWDVFLGGPAAEVARAMAGDGRIASLVTEAERSRASAYDALRRRLAAPSTRRLLLRLALLPFLAPWEEGTDVSSTEIRAMKVRLFAPAILDRRYKRMIGGAHDVAGLPLEALHSTRKSGKKLRYALEFFSPVLPRRDVRRLSRRLARAQDELGAINDTETGAALLAGLTRGGRHEFASGAVLGWLSARAIHARAPLADTWSRLRRQDRFWRRLQVAES